MIFIAIIIFAIRKCFVFELWQFIYVIFHQYQLSFCICYHLLIFFCVTLPPRSVVLHRARYQAARDPGCVYRDATLQNKCMTLKYHTTAHNTHNKPRTLDGIISLSAWGINSWMHVECVSICNLSVMQQLRGLIFTHVWSLLLICISHSQLMLVQLQSSAPLPACVDHTHACRTHRRAHARQKLPLCCCHISLSQTKAVPQFAY